MSLTATLMSMFPSTILGMSLKRLLRYSSSLPLKKGRARRPKGVSSSNFLRSPSKYATNDKYGGPNRDSSEIRSDKNDGLCERMCHKIIQWVIMNRARQN